MMIDAKTVETMRDSEPPAMVDTDGQDDSAGVADYPIRSALQKRPRPFVSKAASKLSSHNLCL
jgi:hypothetical protein